MLSLVLLMILSTVPVTGVLPRAQAADSFELIPTLSHHVAELNSDQLYVAGFHVGTPDLEKRERVWATAITVSFPSTNTSYFPVGSWLGAGMFVQGQDSKLRNVDYGFYTMLVLDSEGSLYLDLGMHQTREGTAPLQTPSEQLMYAFTWLIQGISPETLITLTASWDAEGWVHYLLAASGFNISLPAVYVPDMPGCSSVIRKFYCGNVIIGPFPFSRYIHYFQFGVVSSTAIADDHWSVNLKEPRLLRETGWALADNAWSIRGDISYLDYNWMWGGAPYEGVSAEYRENSGQPPYEVAFFYSGRTLAPGTVLWDVQTAGNYSGMFPSRVVSAWTASLVFSLILIVVFFAPSIVGRRRNNRVYEGFSDKSGSDRHKKLQHGL
jgi:hypothetical protein